MTVISLFDGMSCGRVALERAGVQVDRYYASEVDKYAIAISKKNYPDIVHIGDVRECKFRDGVLNGKYEIEGDVLLIGGSPCQGFSFAGKQLNFEDDRSKLFFEFVRMKEELQPKYFLLENVKMKESYQDVISEYLEIEPIKINSSLVSAQNRERLYWSNIADIKQPDDKGIVLRDILEDGIGYTKNKGNIKYRYDKANCLDANYFRGVDNRGQRTGVINGLIHIGDIDVKGHESMKRVYSAEGKAPTLNSMNGGGARA